jgi:uncharacterized protein
MTASYVLDVIDPRTDPEPEGWAPFCAAQQTQATWDYGLMRLEGMRSGTPNLLVTARDGSGLIAAFVVLLAGYRSGLRREPGRVRGLSTVTPRWIEVQNRWLSGFPAWAFAEHLDPDARRTVLRAFERAVCRYAGPGCLGVVYRAVQPHELTMVRGRGRITRAALGYAELDNTFGTFDDWAASVPADRRRKFRRQQRKITEDPELVVEFAPGRTDLDGAELAALLNEHHDRHGRDAMDPRGYHSPDYLRELVRRSDVRTATYRTTEGRLIGFGTLLDHPVHPVGQHWASVPVEAGGKQHLYFDCYLRMIQRMIDNGAKSLSAGRGMLDVKGKLGFATRELFGVVVPRPVAG